MDDLYTADSRPSTGVSSRRFDPAADPVRFPHVVERRPRLDLRRPRIASSSLRSSRIPNPRDRLWLAKTLDRVVGAIGILHETPHVARLSCFRVQPEWRQTAVLARLMDQAHHYCWNQGYLKLVVPSHVAPFVVQQMFDHRGFQLVRRKRSGQTERLEYIVDLYYVPRRAS